MIAVQWLDKRGTAIVCLTLAKEGRLLVKTSMDLNGWFDDLQVSLSLRFGLFVRPSVSITICHVAVLRQRNYRSPPDIVNGPARKS